ncbi:hypothetical protein [Herbaspirillum huttiense]|uniref:hypothetical protein n=1 Tax=Herbaspirillum huttiense TaxID=863372 RepID=UPI002E79AA1B|nr:hypothetical protein [Herbaspirillum huttiense]MEE1636330.1 hypothetical protein [Herbaspirillum huttiense NC40101]
MSHLGGATKVATKEMTQIQVRTSKENHLWLKKKAAEMERSANWIADKILSDARMRDLAERENAVQ